MTLRLEGLVEHWGSESLLFVRLLPGFQISGRSTAELRSIAGDALQAHLEWLVSRDLIDEPPADLELVIAEELTAREGKTGPRFQDDLIAPSEQELENALAVGRAALSDLIDAFDSLPDDVDRGPSERTLRHVATLDRQYAAALGTAGKKLTPKDPIEDLVDAAGAFEDAVDDFVSGNRPELLRVKGEEWTLAKALRRRTGHLREHLIDIGASEA